MKPVILLIADDQDIHATEVSKAIGTRATVVRFDGTKFRESLNITFRAGKESVPKIDSNIIIDGFKFNLGDIKGVLNREYVPPSFPNSFDPNAKNLDWSEHHDSFWGTLQVADAVWVNHPLAERRASLKLEQLLLAQKYGLTIPETICSNDPQEIEIFLGKHESVICKLLSQDFYINDNLEDELAVYTSEVSAKQILDSKKQLRVCPTLFQSKINKVADIRVNVVGQNVFAAKIESQVHKASEVDFRLIGNLELLTHTAYDLPDSIKSACLSFLEDSGLLFGAFDFALTPDGDHVFFEVNLAGNWLWIEYMLGFPISARIADTLLRKT